jgi:putative ABC transport system permease protein
MHRLFDPFLFAFERLWQHRVLVMWTLVGLSAATTMALSLTLYVDAVNTDLLTDNLSHPPYVFRFRYLGSWDGNIDPDDVARTDNVMMNNFATAIDLPIQQQNQYISGGNWTIRRDEATGATQFGVYALGTLSGADAQMQIVAGEWPAVSNVTDGVIPVLMSENLLYTTGLQIGDQLTATRAGGTTVTLEIVALWRAVNTSDPTWILTPRFFDQVFLMQEDDFWGILEGTENPVEEVDWQLIFDGSSLRTADVNALLDNIANGQRDVIATLPAIRIDVSPEDGLKAFNEDVQQLTQQLVIVVLPIGGLILYFVTMLAGMLVGRQQQEDVTLSSRGMSRRALLGLHALMWLILAGIALLIGLVLSPFVVRLIGRTTSFLKFTDTETDLTIVFTQQAILIGMITGLVAASSGLLMAWRTTGQSIHDFKRQQGRARKAWWQRLYLDVMLLIPAGYIFYTLSAEGGLATDAEDPFGDPLVFLAPTLFSLGVTLLFLRLYPFVLNVSARLVAMTRSIALLMALRELTRSIGRYRSTLLMMCFTLSLIGFTASMASTLDRSLEDVIDYQIGADSVLVLASDAQTEEEEGDDGSATLTVVGYNTLPAADLMVLDGINDVSRVGRYDAQIVLARQRITGTIVGVDRGALAAIARFREDYADEPLADLLNELAGNRTGVLINRETAETYNLLVGQEITLQVLVLNGIYETTVPIMGVVDYFPTLDPSEGFFLIGNLDPIFELVGTELPHNIWLNTTADVDKDALEAEIRELGFPVLRWLDPESALIDAQRDPARRGVLGFLSVGFVSSIFLTLVGSVIQSAASFRAQSIQIGSLRAMGLGSWSVGVYMMLSQGIAAIGGVVGGTLIGIATTVLFLPLLDFSGGLPPYLIRVAWGEIFLVYSLFAAMLLLVTLLTTLMLGREHASTLIKLGDV